MLLTSKNVALLVKIMKTPYFKNSLKNPIFEIEGTNMDQMKENYLTHMNLVLTHFYQNVILYGCCSQRLIWLNALFYPLVSNSAVIDSCKGPIFQQMLLFLTKRQSDRRNIEIDQKIVRRSWFFRTHLYDLSLTSHQISCLWVFSLGYCKAMSQ